MFDRITPDELRLAIDGARLSCWTWDFKADVIRWSSHLGDIYNVEAAQFPTNIAELSAILPPSIGANLQEQILASADQLSGRFELDHPITRHGGTDGWVRNSGHVEFDDEHRPVKLCAIANDITAEKQTSSSLQKLQTLFHRFSEVTSDYIYEVDMTKRPLVPDVVVGSYERVVGYTAVELAEKGGWTGIINPEDLKAGQEVWNNLEAGVPTVHEYRILNAQGELRWIRDHCFPVLESGKLIKLIGGVKDISETKALQDQLVQAQKHQAMAHLVGAVAHDFNNLLFVISATTEVISPQRDDLEDLKADVLTSCNRAADLTRSLLAFARKELPEQRTIRLSEAISATKSMLQRAVGEQIKIHMEYSDTTNDKVVIDPGQLQLLLLNFATNARTAMSGQGEMAISVSAVDPETIDIPEMKSGETVLLAVKDSGCGIAKDKINRVFDTFFTTKSAEEGSGIGLATCSQIIARAGGTIRVKSEVGHGTTFLVYLPTVQTAVCAEPSRSAKYLVGGTERILVVEDDANVRRLSIQMLLGYGYDVCGVDSVRAARQAVAASDYDLVVVDAHLPDGDGCTLINELKRTNPGLSALLVSAYIDSTIRDRARADGHNILPKPFSASALARSVRTTLNAVK